MILNPSDTQITDSVMAGNFGTNRKVQTGTQVKSQDYTKSIGGSSNIKENPVDDTTRDIDDMSDPKARKREFSRRAETNDHADHNKERFHEIDSDTKPLEDNSAVLIPDNKKHGSKIKNHFGEGQYESEVH